MAILTISRQPGSLGDEVAEALSRRLNWDLINRDELIRRHLKSLIDPQDYHFLSESSKYFNYHSESLNMTYMQYLEQQLLKAAESQSMVLVGFGSQLIFADHPEAQHIRVIAPEPIRIDRIRGRFGVSEQDARQILVTADRRHRRFVSTVFSVDLTDASLYDLTLNTGHLSIDACVASIVAIRQELETMQRLKSEQIQPDVKLNQNLVPDFKHPAEIEFARILDMYQIEWKYEPKTFPVEWDAEGNVTLAFSPDFYLPQFDTYLELTTMNQKYVTMKNRKARRLRELYPGIHVKIVYKKDFQSLIERFSGQEASHE
ncbi:MAG: cytidylate kinase-like family protein [Clostridia bacterium]|nr:cytidylate kinase-like family protein [Clostridia bacterium]